MIEEYIAIGTTGVSVRVKTYRQNGFEVSIIVTDVNRNEVSLVPIVTE